MEAGRCFTIRRVKDFTENIGTSRTTPLECVFVFVEMAMGLVEVLSSFITSFIFQIIYFWIYYIPSAVLGYKGREKHKVSCLLASFIIIFIRLADIDRPPIRESLSSESVVIDEVVEYLSMNALSNVPQKKVKSEKKFRRKRFAVKKKTDFISENASHVIGLGSLKAKQFDPGCAMKRYQQIYQEFIKYREILKE